MKKVVGLYIERLKKKDESIEESLDPELLEANDKDLTVMAPVEVTGKAYLAGDFLLIEFVAVTKVQLFCSICNEPFLYEVTAKEGPFEVAVDDVTDGVYDLLPQIREAILISIPFYPQCATDHCANRSELEKFFKKETKASSPFENL